MAIQGADGINRPSFGFIPARAEGSADEDFKNTREIFRVYYWTAGRLSNFQSKWNSSCCMPLPEFGIGQSGANQWFEFFLQNPQQRVKMLRLLANYEELRPYNILPRELLSLADKTEREVNSASATFNAPRREPFQINVEALPMHARIAPIAAAVVQATPPVPKPEVTNAMRERTLLILSVSWLEHYSTNPDRLAKLASTWNRNITDMSPLPDFGTNYHAAQEAQNYFICNLQTLGSLFAILASFPDLKPNALSKEEAIRLADPAVLHKLSSAQPLGQGTSAPIPQAFQTEPFPRREVTFPANSRSASNVASVAQPEVTNAMRENRLLRLNESWNNHYANRETRAILAASWELNFGEQLPYFGDSYRAAGAMHSYFISHLTPLGKLFAILASIKDLRPQGLSEEEARHFADPAALATFKNS